MAEQHEWVQRRLSRRRLMASGAAGLLLVSAPRLWRPPSAAAAPSGIGSRHISFGSDPSSAITVEFATQAAFRHGSVQWISEDGHSVTQDVELQTVPGSTRYYCRASATTLRQDTSYRYSITLDGSSAGGGMCRTASSKPHPFRFTAYGDQGEGATQQAVIAQVGRLTPTLNLMCGDLCYANERGDGRGTGRFFPERWDEWLEQNDPVTQGLPFLSIPGNQEMEPGFGMHGYAGFLARVNPGGASPLTVPVATSMRLSNVAFIGLDSNDVSFEIPANRGWTQGAQTAWLRQRVQDARKSRDVDFIVVFLHHSPYSTSSQHGSEGGIVEEWVPLFDQFSVDLVISGHNHCYERTRPIRLSAAVDTPVDSYHSDLGTTYITAGGGGAGGELTFSDPTETRIATASGSEQITIDWALDKRSDDPSVLYVDVAPATSTTPATMKVQAVRTDGSPLDQLTLMRGSPKDHRELYVGAAATVAVGGVAAIATSQLLRHRRQDAASGQELSSQEPGDRVVGEGPDRRSSE